MSVSAGPELSSSVTKRELAAQLSALQNDVAELTAAFDHSEAGAASSQGATLADEALQSIRGQREAASASGTNLYSSANNFLEQGENSDNPSVSCVDFDIPKGATTLLSQLARAQRSLQIITQERDSLQLELARVKRGSPDGGRSKTPSTRSRSPSNSSNHHADALIKMRQLFESLEKDHELLRLTLENSEKIRLQQKELIHLLQDHRVTNPNSGGTRDGSVPASSRASGRSRRSQSPAPRRTSVSASVSPGRPSNRASDRLDKALVVRDMALLEPRLDAAAAAPSSRRGVASSGVLANGRPGTAPSSNHMRAQSGAGGRPSSSSSNGSATENKASTSNGVKRTGSKAGSSRSVPDRSTTVWAEDGADLARGGSGVTASGRSSSSNTVAARSRKTTRDAKGAGLVSRVGRAWA
jgi:hypothetical protein